MLYAFDSEIMENVFEWHPLCPCLMKKDMVASGDVYRFLEEYIGVSRYLLRLLNKKSTEN